MVTSVRVSATARGAYRTLDAALVDTAGAAQVRVAVDGGEHEISRRVSNRLEIEPSGQGGPVRLLAAGAVLFEVTGELTVREVALVNYAGTVLHSPGGALTLHDCEVRAQGADARCVDAGRGARVAATGCVFRAGPVRLTGARGTFERCTFLDSPGNAVTVWKDADARLHDCTLAEASAHGAWVSASTATVTGCMVRNTGKAALVAADGATLAVLDVGVADVPDTAVLVTRHSTGEARRTWAERVDRGLQAIEQSRVTVESLQLTDCRVTGLMVKGNATIEGDDATVRGARRYGCFVGLGTLRLRRLAVTGGEIGICVSEGELDLDRTTLTRNEVGLQLRSGAFGRLARGRIEGAGLGVQAEAGGVSVELDRVAITDPGRGAVSLAGDARLGYRHGTVAGAADTALVLAGSSRLTIGDSTVSGTADGVRVGDTALLDATALRVRDCGGAGVVATGTARVWLRGCVLTGNAGGDLLVDDTAERRVEDSTIGTGDRADSDGDGTGGTGGQVRTGGDGTVGTDGQARPGGDGTGEQARDGDGPVPVGRVGDPLAELAELVGLQPVKEQVRTQVTMIRMAERRRAAGLSAPPLSRHLVFSGPPGTGKTTVARLYGRILAALGVLGTGTVHEVTRSQLVGQYLGATAPKTRAAFDAAAGGILFIDEAYTLARRFGAGSDFGQEAIDEIVALMENRREDVVVIVAGYTAEMNDFLDANPGLRSRFSRVVEFPPYQVDELVEITELIAARHHYRLDDAVWPLLRERYQRRADDGEPGNAREARTLFETMVERHAERLFAADEADLAELQTLRAADLP